MSEKKFPGPSSFPAIFFPTTVLLFFPMLAPSIILRESTLLYNLKHSPTTIEAWTTVVATCSRRISNRSRLLENYRRSNLECPWKRVDQHYFSIYRSSSWPGTCSYSHRWPLIHELNQLDGGNFSAITTDRGRPTGSPIWVMAPLIIRECKQHGLDVV